MTVMRIAQGPVWRASRGAVKRRKVQTLVIGIVVFICAATSVMALGLLAASSAPFDKAFAKQNGPHAVAAFDAAKADDAQLAATAHASGVTAAAGPFPEVSAEMSGFLPGAGTSHVSIVGRADPGGRVDRLDLWQGRWATVPGEVVIGMAPGDGPPPGTPGALGGQVTVDGSLQLTIVGYAYSLVGSVDAWVTPGQLAMLHPTKAEMLYRFQNADSSAQITANLNAATAGLPSGALLGSQDWLTVKASMTAKLASFLPMLFAFGILGVTVAVLIVLNVVGGAVVSGFRDIGIYKTIGFTPRQVCGAYVAMMAVPAFVGTVLGVPAGVLFGSPMLDKAFRSLGGSQTIPPLVDVACLIGVPLVVALAAFVPARRAARMSATAAISAGSAPKRGRGLKVQRKLAGSRLPRPISMGLGQPFARPARSALTLAAVLIGVTTVVFANGLVRTMTAYSTASDRNGAVSLVVGSAQGQPNRPTRKLDGNAMEAAIRATPGVDAVAPRAWSMVGVAGMTAAVDAEFYGGDSAKMGYVMVKGHWLDGPNQIVVPARFLSLHHLAVGQSLTLELNGQSVRAAIVGEVITGSDQSLYADWTTLHQLVPDRQADTFEVHVKQGSDIQSAVASLQARDPAWHVYVHDIANPNSGLRWFAGVFTVTLSTVAALGVFNTVLLNTRERRRDLGMLKSIGMTPRQVVAMIVTSMGVLGLVGGVVGLPLGYALHAVVMPVMGRAGGVAWTPAMLHVYTVPLLLWMFLAGLGIALIGALVPARSAARLTIAEVLHNE